MTDQEWENDVVPAHVVRAVRTALDEMSVVTSDPVDDDVVDAVFEILGDDVDEAAVRRAIRDVRR